MKKYNILILAIFLLLGLKGFAQNLEIPPTLGPGDSLRVIMKSGIYNYGILQNRTDMSLLVFIDNQKTATTLYTNRIAEVFVFKSAQKVIVTKSPSVQNREETFGVNVSDRGSSIATLRVGDEVEIRTRKGNYFKGVVDRNMVMRIDIRTKNNNIIAIPKDDILYLRIARDYGFGKIDEEKTLENSKAFTRYFFAPSAIKNKQGTFVYDNSYGLINSLSYSPTDFLSITGAAEFISTIIGEPIVMLSPHVGFNVGEKLYLGGGFIYGNTFNTESVSLNAFYGTITAGDNVRNFTINFGRGIERDAAYTLNISGYAKLNRNFALISENWIFDDSRLFGESIPLIGIGGRVFGPKVNFDFALINLVVPYLGFSYRFN